MEEGKIVRVVMRQSDGQVKIRPAVVLRKLRPFNDWLICGISSSIGLEVKGFDVIISKTDAEFKYSGLKRTSVIRLGYITWMEEKNIDGAIGSVSRETHTLLLNRLANYLKE